MAGTESWSLKATAFNEANETAYDPYSGWNDSYSEQFAKIPWPEWNDADLNSEIWEEKVRVSENVLFEDSDPPILPSSIVDYVDSWQRPFEVFPDALLTVYDPDNTDFELFVESSEARCEFLQSFIELLTILQVYASEHSFVVEWESPTFTSNTQGEVWRPWHHVYSCCKAGKGQVHQPVYNPYGKYVVRLFYMGCWRKFIIDDTIPCDSSGRCMLPLSRCRGELWPILLAKGVLKIASLTSGFTLYDFPIISFFTGWIWYRIVAKNKSNDQIWRRLFCLTPQFKYNDDEAEYPEPETMKASSKKGSLKDTERVDFMEKTFCFVLSNLEGLSPDDDVNHIHRIALTMNRDVPVVKCEKREPTKAWKRNRWVYWASAKGIWIDERKLPPYRRGRFFACSSKLTKFLVPDPKEEAAFFDVQAEAVRDAAEDGIDDRWFDFMKLRKFLSSLNVFFLPSCLPFSFEVTSLNTLASNKIVQSSGGTRKASSKAAPQPVSQIQNSYFLPIYVSPNRNEPCLLFCDSTSYVTLIFSLSVCPIEKISLFGYLDPEQHDCLKVGQASLIIERFDWRMIEENEILGMIKTVGNFSFCLNLSRGRNILKLWLKTSSPYILKIFSNVEVFVNKSLKIRFLMNSESQRILQYIGKVSNAFIELIHKFGKPNLSSSLRSFYDSIMPGNDKDLYYRWKLDDFIETFLLCLLESLKSLAANTEELKMMMDALQSLFINPKIRCDLPKGDGVTPIHTVSSAKRANKKYSVCVRDRTSSVVPSNDCLQEEIHKAITIQRMFRGHRVRLLWKHQNPARKEFKVLSEKLKKISDVVFSPGKREVEVGKLIRQVATTNHSLLTTFKFHDDFSRVIQLEEVTGKVGNVEPFAWVPFARFIVACHSDDPLPFAFYFSANIEQFVVQVIDNDTNEELFRLSNSAMPNYYERNSNGYTVLIYGWNEANAKTVNWRLQMVKMRHFQVVHLCNTMLGSSCFPYSIPSIDILEIKNFYVPNKMSRVCRCFIKIQKRTLITVRLSVSFSSAEFYVKIYPKDSDNFNQPNGSTNLLAFANSFNASILLPSVILDYIEPNSFSEHVDDESTVYILEAFILKDTWPLTKHEWGIVESFRVNGESWKDSSTSLKKGQSDSRRKLTRMSKRSLNEQKVLEDPYWFLQVMTDSPENPDSRDQLVVEEDKTYADSVKAMKVAWEEKNPGRRKKGRELRYNFLLETFLENERKQEEKMEKENREVEGEWSGESVFPTRSPEDKFKLLLDQLSNFSYLTNDTTSARFLKSPRVLPNVPLQELLERYRTQVAPLSKTAESSYGMNCESGDTLSAKEYEIQRMMREQVRPFLSKLHRCRKVLENGIEEEQKMSVLLTEQAYEERLKAIERLAR